MTSYKTVPFRFQNVHLSQKKHQVIESLHPEVVGAVHYWKPTRFLILTISSWWLNQPIWKICSSNWIISPSRGEKKKYLKPPTRFAMWFLRCLLNDIGFCFFLVPSLNVTASLHLIMNGWKTITRFLLGWIPSCQVRLLLVSGRVNDFKWVLLVTLWF